MTTGRRNAGVTKHGVSQPLPALTGWLWALLRGGSLGVGVAPFWGSL